MTSYIEAYASDEKDIKTLLSHEINVKKNVKVALIANCEFTKYDSNGDIEDIYEIRIRTTSWLIRGFQDIREFQSHVYPYISNRIQDFQENGSNWVLDEILYSDLEIGKCNSLNGSCGILDVTYTRDLKKIAPKSDSKMCFARAVAFHFKKNRNEKKIERFIKRKMKTSGLPFPLDLEDIPKFEKMNSHLNFKINVFTTDDLKSFYPIYCGKEKNKRHIINLLLYKSVNENGHHSGQFHYAYINNLAKLVRKKWFHSYQKILFCGNCLSSFYNAKLLASHEDECHIRPTEKIRMPDHAASIKFKNFNKKFKKNLVGFYDFECMLVPSLHPCSTCAEKQLDVCHHKTIEKNVHKPITYSYLILTSEGKIVKEGTYTGEDCMDHFIDTLLSIESELLKILNTHKKMIYRKKDRKRFLKATSCHICEEKFAECEIMGGDEIVDLEGGIDLPLNNLGMKVRDHDHISGKYLGAAHGLCNIQRGECKNIPMFCHNGNGYDNHILLKHLKKDPRLGPITGLPLNSEKFRTLEFNSYTFLDSLAFLNASLDELVKSLDKDHAFTILDQSKLYSENDNKKSLLLQKGVFPYEFFQNSVQLKLICLPEKKQFHSSLANADISQEDYKHALDVWDEYNCTSFKDYVELYCKTDVYLLAEVMTCFRNEIHRECGLDPYHYVSLPQLGYDIMLKKTGVEIGLIKNIDQLLMIEKGLRGGMSFIGNRYSESMPQSNNRKSTREISEEGMTRLIYLDGKHVKL